MKYLQGYFKPKNPHKYCGDPSNIIYRSSLELRLFKFLDDSEHVISYASEEMSIPYVSPIDNRIHRYFPDVVIKKRGADGKVSVVIMEVKPSVQTKPPRTPKSATAANQKRLLNEAKTYAINSAKWKAARKFCEEHGWEFVLITEKELVGK